MSKEYSAPEATVTGFDWLSAVDSSNGIWLPEEPIA